MIDPICGLHAPDRTIDDCSQQEERKPTFFQADMHAKNWFARLRVLTISPASTIRASIRDNIYQTFNCCISHCFLHHHCLIEMHPCTDAVASTYCQQG